MATKAQKDKAVSNISRAKVQLALHQPFFAGVVFKRTLALSETMPTTCIDRTGKITLGVEFAAKLTVQQTMFLLAHETMHYILLHLERLGTRNHRAANVAMDKVINDILKDSKVGEPIPEGVFQEGARAYTWEQLYNEEDGSGGGYKPGEGNDDLSDDGEPLTSEQIEGIKQEIIQAASAAKAQGKMPTGLVRMVDSIVNPVTPWPQLLERYMLQLIKQGTSYRRPNKRFMGHDLYMPSTDRQPRMGTMVVQVDESGSVGSDELAHFAGHLNKILETCMPERLITLHTSSRVACVEEFTADDFPIKLEAKTTGGTDMEAGFRWCEEQGIEPDVFVCLTDLWTDFTSAPCYPVVWLSTTKDRTAPYGETIYYEVT